MSDISSINIAVSKLLLIIKDDNIVVGDITWDLFGGNVDTTATQ